MQKHSKLSFSTQGRVDSLIAVPNIAPWMCLVEMDQKVSKEYERLQVEIQREKAEALGRVGERLELVLRKLDEWRHTIDTLRGKLEEASLERDSILQAIRGLTQEHNALREKAMTYRRYLIIQREAVGFYDHREVDRHYRIPDPIGEIQNEGS